MSENDHQSYVPKIKNSELMDKVIQRCRWEIMQQEDADIFAAINAAAVIVKNTVLICA